MHVDETQSTFLAQAELKSPPLGRTSLACTMTFMHHQGGSDNSGITQVQVSASIGFISLTAFYDSFNSEIQLFRLKAITIFCLNYSYCLL